MTGETKIAKNENGQNALWKIYDPTEGINNTYNQVLVHQNQLNKLQAWYQRCLQTGQPVNPNLPILITHQRDRIKQLFSLLEIYRYRDNDHRPDPNISDQLESWEVSLLAEIDHIKRELSNHVTQLWKDSGETSKSWWIKLWKGLR